ncbi:hypothetical protein PAJ34TS1_63830 [Paenibacillus azoreducens]|uniref:Uncharacterized protein n=1 Tax=Paenibacillus azoreducens TaxID=116718 RepID=A0A919YDX3_9BACL|nr:hypothetical protein J34TS1_41620 [Paenibacillus azoreducens]
MPSSVRCHEKHMTNVMCREGGEWAACTFSGWGSSSRFSLNNTAWQAACDSSHIS